MLLLGALLIYLLVRIAVSHGVTDADAFRQSEECYAAFDRALESGGMSRLTAPDDSAPE